MIMEKRLPIKFFSKREEDKQRVEGNSIRNYHAGFYQAMNYKTNRTCYQQV